MGLDDNDMNSWSQLQYIHVENIYIQPVTCYLFSDTGGVEVLSGVDMVSDFLRFCQAADRFMQARSSNFSHSIDSSTCARLN